MFWRSDRARKLADQHYTEALTQEHARLEARVKEAVASSDPDLVVDVANEVFASLRDIVPYAQKPHVTGAIVDRTRWFVVLASQLPQVPWQHLAVCGALYSGAYTLNLDVARSKLENSDWSEQRKREFTGIIFSLMASGRGVLPVTAYSWHRYGVPGLIGSILETGAGTLFDTDQHLTGLRSVTSDLGKQAKLARSHERYLRKLKQEDLPLTHFLPAEDANALNEKYLARQIQKVVALPADLRLVGADVKNVTTQLAAITADRDVIYLVITLRGSCAVRYPCDPERAAQASSIEIDSLSSEQVHRWLDDAAHAYSQFQNKAIDEHSLSRSIRRILTAIGDHVLMPVLEGWPDLQRFTLIPSESAGLLPLFSAIVDGKPACASYDFTVCPSARAMYTAASFAPAAPTSALVAADPSEGDTYIQYTADEARLIAELYGTEVVGPSCAEQAEASRGRSLRAVSDTPDLPYAQQLSAWPDLDAGVLRPVVHFACHGVLTDFPDPDARLLLGEGISLHDFTGSNARPISPGGVVVLSACSVGGVAAAAPNELIGFPTVLLGAGVRNVIAPQWPVVDSPATVDLMVNFHEGLRSGLAPNTALANAISVSSDAGSSCAVWGVFGSYGC